MHAPLSQSDAAHKSWGAIYLMVQQQAAMLSFVEAFWVMGVIFWAMAPLLLLLRNARDLHPHTPSRPVSAKTRLQSPKAAKAAEPEPELVGAAPSTDQQLKIHHGDTDSTEPFLSRGA